MSQRPFDCRESGWVDDPRNATGREIDRDVCLQIHVVCLLTIGHVTTLGLDPGSDRFGGRESANGREPEADHEWHICFGPEAGQCGVRTPDHMTDADRKLPRLDSCESQRLRLTHWWFD